MLSKPASMAPQTISTGVSPARKLNGRGASEGAVIERLRPGLDAPRAVLSAQRRGEGPILAKNPARRQQSARRFAGRQRLSFDHRRRSLRFLQIDPVSRVETI